MVIYTGPEISGESTGSPWSHGHRLVQLGALPVASRLTYANNSTGYPSVILFNCEFWWYGTNTTSLFRFSELHVLWRSGKSGWGILDTSVIYTESTHGPRLVVWPKSPCRHSSFLSETRAPPPFLSAIGYTGHYRRSCPLVALSFDSSVSTSPTHCKFVSGLLLLPFLVRLHL